MPTKVVFRKFRNGDVIALFPQIPHDRQGYFCQAYQHIGQHGAADPAITNDTKPATKKEYEPLLKELHRIGYRNLVIAKRITYADFEARKKAAAPSCGCQRRL